jgi:hypothetical protein
LLSIINSAVIGVDAVCVFIGVVILNNVWACGRDDFYCFLIGYRIEIRQCNQHGSWIVDGVKI